MGTKRRLIDIYGHEEGFEYNKLDKATLERKADFCDHLLSLAARLSPGKSEMRGYLLWERHGSTLRLAQWDWRRMNWRPCPLSWRSWRSRRCTPARPRRPLSQACRGRTRGSTGGPPVFRRTNPISSQFILLYSAKGFHYCTFVV